MTIETKYNFGNKVWIMWDNKPAEVSIKNIFFNTNCANTLPVRYEMYEQFQSQFGSNRFEEQTVFPDKEKLLKSL